MTLESRMDKTNELLALILGVIAPKDVVAAAPPVPVPVKAPATVVKTKPAAVKPVPTPAVAAAVEDNFDFESPEGAPEVKKLTVDDARKALVALQKAKSSAEASRKILADNGLASLASLKDEQQDLIAKIISGCTSQMPKA